MRRVVLVLMLLVVSVAGVACGGLGASGPPDVPAELSKTLRTRWACAPATGEWPLVCSSVGSDGVRAKIGVEIEDGRLVEVSGLVDEAIVLDARHGRFAIGEARAWHVAREQVQAGFQSLGEAVLNFETSAMQPDLDWHAHVRWALEASARAQAQADRLRRLPATSVDARAIVDPLIAQLSELARRYRSIADAVRSADDSTLIREVQEMVEVSADMSIQAHRLQLLIAVIPHTAESAAAALPQVRRAVARAKGFDRRFLRTLRRQSGAAIVEAAAAARRQFRAAARRAARLPVGANPAARYLSESLSFAYREVASSYDMYLDGFRSGDPGQVRLGDVTRTTALRSADAAVRTLDAIVRPPTVR